MYEDIYMPLDPEDKRACAILKDMTEIVGNREMADTFNVSQARITQMKSDGSWPFKKFRKFITFFNGHRNHSLTKPTLQALADYLFENSGFRLYEPQQFKDPHLGYHASQAKAIKEFADILRVSAEAIIDGYIDPNEAEEIYQRCCEAQDALQSHKNLLQNIIQGHTNGKI